MSTELLIRIAAAIGLGFAVGLAVGFLRGFGSVGRLRFSAVLATWMAGAYLLLRSTGVVHEALTLQVVLALAVLAGADAFLQLLDLLFWRYLLDRRRRVFVPRLLVDVFNLLALLAVGLLVVKYAFGISLTGLLVTSTVLSAIIGLALQDILGNLVAGLALQVERPFTVGDWVVVGGREGYVTQLNWRTLAIRTRDSDDVIIPNAVVAKAEISNQSRPSPLQRMHATVGVSYEHPPGIVKEALTRAAASADGVVGEPVTDVLIRSYGEFAIQYDVRFWITDYAIAPQIIDDVYSRIWYELHRCELTIPMPTRSVTMRTVPEDEELRRRSRREREIFRVLRPLDLFSPLSDDQIQELVGSASLHRYGRNEVLVRQGDVGASLFVLKSGSARVEVAVDGGSPARLDTLEAGAFFGEMSLLTGAPRSASVVAESDTEVVIVDKSAFAPILTSDTGILEGLTDVIERHEQNQARLPAADTGEPEEEAPPARAAILRSISRFFGMSDD